jgi:hypothetical protein
LRGRDVTVQERDGTEKEVSRSDGVPESLLATDVALGGLNADVAEQKLNLIEFSTCLVTQPRTSATNWSRFNFLLGHVSVQTTERYLGCTQRISSAVNDRIGIEAPPRES